MLPALARSIFVSVLLCALAIGAEKGPATLRMASSVPWTVPPFQSHGDALCDADGNLYFDVWSGKPPTVVLKVAHDSSKYELYGLPPAPAGNDTGRLRYSVTADGKLRVLGYITPTTMGKLAPPGWAYVFTYGSEPNNPSKAQLDLPEQFHPDYFAAFESGAILLTGYFPEQADKRLRGKIYTAVFQASGKLAAEVTGDYGKVALATMNRKLREGGIASGDDGFLYVLRSDSVLVVSESGSIVRKLPLKKTDPEFAATQIYVSGGVVVVGLAKGEGLGKPVRDQFLAMNASTGERMGPYEPEPALGNNAVCFSRDEGLTFWTVKDGKDVLAVAPLR